MKTSYKIALGYLGLSLVTTLATALTTKGFSENENLEAEVVRVMIPSEAGLDTSFAARCQRRVDWMEKSAAHYATKTDAEMMATVRRASELREINLTPGYTK